MNGASQQPELPGAAQPGGTLYYHPRQLRRSHPSQQPSGDQPEQELIAASDSVGVTGARLFPDITPTGGLGYVSDDFDDLLDSDGEFFIVQLDLVMPLFNAGAQRIPLSRCIGADLCV